MSAYGVTRSQWNKVLQYTSIYHQNGSACRELKCKVPHLCPFQNGIFHLAFVETEAVAHSNQDVGMALV